MGLDLGQHDGNAAILQLPFQTLGTFEEQLILLPHADDGIDEQHCQQNDKGSLGEDAVSDQRLAHACNIQKNCDKQQNACIQDQPLHARGMEQLNHAQKEQQLQEQIDAETKRSEEIEEYRKYTQTQKYVEEVAKEKLGLVNENEIIFKEE